MRIDLNSQLDYILIGWLIQGGYNGNIKNGQRLFKKVVN